MFSKFSWLTARICIIFLFLFCKGGTCMRGGFLVFRFICYRNPGHLNALGSLCDSLPSSNCDPFFNICISNRYIRGTIKAEQCSIYQKITLPFNNEENVCDKPEDNRKDLGKDIFIELAYPFPMGFFVKIEVRDSDQWTAYQPPIASFSTDFRAIPSSNLSAPVIKEIQMYRNEFRYGNSKANLKIGLALQCDRDRFGLHCLTFCKSIASSTYTCSNSGEKVCKEGWKGENCLEKDPCFTQVCIEGAICILVNKEPKCMCNGQIGPQCYPHYDPCIINPCENQGRCMPNKKSKTGIYCKCRFPFEGARCESKFDICLIEPCRNNGTCEYDQNYVRICHCLKGFSGRLCDYKLPSDEAKVSNTTSSWNKPEPGMSPFIHPTPNMSSVTILSVLLIVVVLALIIISAFLLIRKRNKKNNMLKNETKLGMKMKDLGKPSAPSLFVPNEYTIGPLSDSLYEVISDTDVDSPDNNDDYLIPSKPLFECQDSHEATNPYYMDMSGKENLYNFEEMKATSRNDSYYLPALPVRNMKKKLSFCS